MEHLEPLTGEPEESDLLQYASNKDVVIGLIITLFYTPLLHSLQICVHLFNSRGMWAGNNIPPLQTSYILKLPCYIIYAPMYK